MEDYAKTMEDYAKKEDYEELLKDMTPFNRGTTMIAVIVPFLVTIGTFLGMWITGSLWASLNDLIIFIIMYSCVGFGVTVGFHRLLTHGSFKTYNIVRYIFACLGTMSAQGSVITWVADHRKHHKYTDRYGDPHTPHINHSNSIFSSLRGLYHAHIGWLLKDRELSDWRDYAKDLYDDCGMRFISRNSGNIVLMGLFIPFMLGWWLSGSLQGAFSGLLWGGLVRIFFLHHVTWSINSICHFHGKRDFETPDRSTNVFWLTLFSFGESWHNNHHAFPKSALHGVKPHQIDTSYILIRLMEKLGLAWDVVRLHQYKRKKDM